MVLCTCPDEATATRLARDLVEARLAACVNVVAEIRSIYRWQDTVHDEPESLMIIKTPRTAYAALEAWLLENHPYDEPEVIALPVTEGSAGYLDWVASQAGRE